LQNCNYSRLGRVYATPRLRCRAEGRPNPYPITGGVGVVASRPAVFFCLPWRARFSYMKTGIAFIVAAGLLATEGFSAAGATAFAAEYRHRGFWRIAPNQCFLPPDIVVALNALGPYCSSPRAHYYYRMRG
jgi:hypothetical protein